MIKIKLLLLMSVFLISSCSLFEKKEFVDEKTATALDIPVGLIRDLTKSNLCQGDYWNSSYGKTSLFKHDELKKMKVEFVLERTPACSLAQSMYSVRLLTYFSKHFSELMQSNRISKSDKINLCHQIIEKHSNILFNDPLSFGELLLELKLLNEVVAEAVKISDKKTNLYISQFKENLKSKQDEILKKSLAHMVLIMQNTAYRTEVYDWSLMSQLGGVSSEISILTSDQLSKLSRHNKYAEILNMEAFKTNILNNFECLKNKDCNICYFAITKNKCVDIKDENIILSENKVFSFYFSSLVSDVFFRFYSSTHKLVN